MQQHFNCHTWTALVTPFEGDEGVDTVSLERLIRDQESAGNGIVLLGSTGEALSLDRSEKVEIVALACSLDLRVPLIIGVGGCRLEESISWIAHCEPLPIAGFLLVTPIYTRPGRHGQARWFHSLLEATSKPCMLYNVPHRSGCHLSLEALEDVIEHPNLWAVKEASGSAETIRDINRRFPSIEIFSGCDEHVVEHIGNGANGIVTVMGNAWPKAVHRYVERCRKGHADEDRFLWERAAGMVNTNNPVAVKQLMHLQGRILSPLTRPPLNPRDVAMVDQLIQEDRAIEEWWKAAFAHH